MSTAMLSPVRSTKSRRKLPKLAARNRRGRVGPAKVELDAEEIALHNAIVKAAARSLAR